ncbi:MFS transporter [Virgisporangium aliadipatigenens]|uniref:MFS transporter n=2 Tax=Virgisporangium aliadipatigenens TaxID=741659 RepID=A0A8J3YJR9_9ACTN|nr:MFS transporter [Virgisporangium aliadipatigenens]
MALVVLCTGTLMVVLDGSIVAVALPVIGRDLGFDGAGLAWVVNAYLIAFGGLLLLAGRVGDLVGRRRVFLAGLVLFTAASLLCGFAGSAAVLVVARFVQGVGGAMASAVALGMVVTLFPAPAERAKALGVYSFTQAAGSSLGLVLGGVLTETAGWHWIFIINVPIGVVAVALVPRLFAAERGLGLSAGADVPGAVLGTAGLMLGVYAIVGPSPLSGVAAVLLIAGFVARQATAAAPLMPLRLVRPANLTMLLLVAGMFGFQFLTALYLQDVLGYGAVATGLAFLPAPVLIAVVSLGLAGRLTARYGERAVLAGGLALIVAGLLLLTRAPADGHYAVDLFPALALLGSGFGASVVVLFARAMSGADDAAAGVTSGIVNTTQQVGGALGLAALASVAARWDFSAAYLGAALLVLLALLSSTERRKLAPQRR